MMLDYSLPVASIMLCGHKDTLMTLVSIAKQVLLATSTLASSSLPSLSPPSLCASLSASAPEISEGKLS